MSMLDISQNILFYIPHQKKKVKQFSFLGELSLYGLSHYVGSNGQLYCVI